MRKRILHLAVAAALLWSMAASAFAASEADEVSILFTHDMHSHFDAVTDGGGESGGFAKLKAAVDGVKAEYPDSFLLDGGDFAMGTPFQTIFSTDAAELRMMGRLGFDATTLGNHEFDYRAAGLADMLDAAVSSGGTIPQLLIANIDWERTAADESRRENALRLREAMERAGARRYCYLKRGGVTAAVFGIFGKESDTFAPESGLFFLDPIETSKQVVAEIQAEGKADLIICLSHSGTNEDPAKSEDELLAKAVPAIDLIVSGHTHTKLEQPIVHGNTAIVSCGQYTDYLGHVALSRSDGRWAVDSYRLLPLDATVAGDPQTLLEIEALRELITENYFARFGYAYDQVLATTDFPFTPNAVFGETQGEEPLGSLISDSYRYAVQRVEGDAYEPVDVAVVPHGVIRGSFGEGPITVADAFNVSSLGIGPDQVPGYPLVSIYLTGAELRTLAEVDISVSPMMQNARLYMSGLIYEYNTGRLILNRVTDVWLSTEAGSVALEKDRLYRVVGGLYSCQMLGAVETQSYGLLSIAPKDKDGVPITDYERHIIYDGDCELKEWAALAEYLASFEKWDGVPVVPQQYAEASGRKIESDSRNLADRIKRPNKIAFLVAGVVALLTLIAVFLILLIVRVVKRLRRKAKSDSNRY